MRYWVITALFLTVAPAVLLAQAPALPDDQVAPTFVKACTDFSVAMPDLAIPCDDFAAGKSPAVLRQYLDLMGTAKAALLAKGPEIAQALLKSCLANAVGDKPDPSGLLFCINLKSRGNDLEKLARGEGSLPDYGKLAKDAGDPVPAYPSADTPDAESQRAEVRKGLVYGCVEQQTGYVQALCGAVAINEIFASRPFGDNGDLAKAFDKVVLLYAVTEGPKAAIQDEAKEVLQRAGINDQVATAIVNPQQGAVEGVKHVAAEAQKVVESIFHW